MKFFRYLLLGIFAYIAFMLLLFPVSAVVSRIKHDPISLTGVSGSLWKGNILKLEAPNTHLPTGPDNFLVEDVKWQVAPMALLKGVGAVGIDFSAYGGHGSGLLEQHTNGNQAVTDLHYEGRGEGISILLDPFVKLEGHLVLDVQKLVFEKRLLKSLESTFQWNNAILQIPTYAKLGNLSLNVKPKDNIHIVDISSDAGDLQVNGQVEIEINGNFKTDIIIKTHANTPVALEDMIRAIARPASDGSYRIRRSGNIYRLM